MEPRSRTSKIIVHCSDTDGGSAQAIRAFHIAPVSLGGRGWEDIGYHFVIDESGVIETGRKENLIGSHCEGENHDSLGVCLIGINHFTDQQFESLGTLLLNLTQKYLLKWSDVYGHYEFPSAQLQHKTCPNFPAELLRAFIQGVCEYEKN